VIEIEIVHEVKTEIDIVKSTKIVVMMNVAKTESLINHGDLQKKNLKNQLQLQMMVI
jgi:hypothetical protein